MLSANNHPIHIHRENNMKIDHILQDHGLLLIRFRQRNTDPMRILISH
jgi:hypothetical protein